jgi:hypothetical protein
MKSDAKAFEGAACEDRLLDWIGTIIGEKIHLTENEHFIIINQASVDWAWFVAAVARGHKLVALGNNASNRISRYIEHFKLPHPSGKNRQINNKTFIRNKLMRCREWLDSK